MRRLKAFFSGLLQPSTSEFWLGWGALITKGLTLIVPQSLPLLDAVASWTGLGTADMLVAALLTYTVGRMTSKAARVKNKK